YQDPLKPVDDKEFIAQLAQFTALEQMTNLNNVAVKTQAFSLIGKYVTGVMQNPDGSLREVMGAVSNVKMVNGKTYLVVRGTDLPIENVTDVTDAAMMTMGNLSAYANLIGSNATGYVYDPDDGQLVQVSGRIVSLMKGLNEDYAVMNGVTLQVTKAADGVTRDTKEALAAYLAERVGQQVKVEAYHPAMNQRVVVTATLRDYTIDRNGNAFAVLDNLAVPLDSISSITYDAVDSEISAYTGIIGTTVKGYLNDLAGSPSIMVEGIARMLKKGTDNLAVVDGASFRIVGVDGHDGDVAEYLQGIMDGHDRKVTLLAYDIAAGKEGKVVGTLVSFVADGELISAVLDGIELPLRTISEIR
ncbi:MAG: hypothetical protein FWE70_04560, partial [Oscillospiraceae bacterium]|nr:hypothetical protein [Oscillospiraceae bacterium]